MNKITELSLGLIVKAFLVNQPVNRIIRHCFLRGNKVSDQFEIFKGALHFLYTKEGDTVARMRVHQMQLLSHLQVDADEKNAYGKEDITINVNGQDIVISVEFDNSLWFTLTSPKFDEIALLAIERAKE